MSSTMKKLGTAVLGTAMTFSSMGVHVMAENETPTVTPGAAVTADPASPSGYTVTFAYDGSSVENVAKVEVSGPFNYTDGEKSYAPEEYQPGMAASNFWPDTKSEVSPFAGTWGRNIEMTDEDGDGVYTVSFPITSGSYGYHYVVTYTDGSQETIADPANPPEAAVMNPNGNHMSGDVTTSIVKGVYDAVKQAGSPNMDYVLDNAKAGSVSYVPYTDIDNTTQYVGVYLPYGYDAGRAEPYKTLYLSHGGGGDESDWFHMGSANEIMDNLSAAGETEAAVIVTMDNNHYDWNFDKALPNIVEKIIPFIEANYNVSTEVEDRAMCGLSMGGQTTTNMFWRYPEVFGYFGMFSGTNAAEDRPMKPAYNCPKVMTVVGNWDFASLPFAGTGADMFAAYSGEGGHFTIETLAGWCEANIPDNYTNAGDIYVPGSHDWFTWPQALAKFLREVAWTDGVIVPSKLEEGLVVEENTDFPGSEAEYQATFTFKGEADAVDLVGGFQFYTKEQGEAFKSGENTTPVSADAYNFKKGMFAQGYDVSGIGNRPYPMKEVAEDVWTVTIPVPAGVWFYAYNVKTADENGEEVVAKTLDPAQETPYNEANGHDNGWSVFVCGTSEEAIAGQEYVFPAEGETGTTAFVIYDAVDGTKQPLGVYLPAGYSTAKKYPVVYVSHGGGGNEVEWHFLGATDNIMDNLIAEGEVEPTIVVTMDNSYWGWDEEKVIGNLMNCIVPFVEKNYSVDTDPDRRAFCGLSMGGGVSNQVWEHNAGDFRYIGIWSGCYPNEDYTEVENKNYPVLLLGHGCMDFAGPGFPVLKDVFDELGVKYDFHEASGAHDWGVWRELFTVFAKDYLWETPSKTEETPVTPDKPTQKPQTGVNTGDTFNAGILGGMLAAGAALAAAAWFALKKRK